MCVRVRLERKLATEVTLDDHDDKDNTGEASAAAGEEEDDLQLNDIDAKPLPARTTRTRPKRKAKARASAAWRDDSDSEESNAGQHSEYEGDDTSDEDKPRRKSTRLSQTAHTQRSSHDSTTRFCADTQTLLNQSHCHPQFRLLMLILSHEITTAGDRVARAKKLSMKVETSTVDRSLITVNLNAKAHGGQEAKTMWNVNNRPGLKEHRSDA